MDAYRTDDEQVEALKRWWKENGTSTLLMVAVAVGGYFGWQAWDTRQVQQAEKYRRDSHREDTRRCFVQYFGGVSPHQQLFE